MPPDTKAEFARSRRVIDALNLSPARPKSNSRQVTPAQFSASMTSKAQTDHARQAVSSVRLPKRRQVASASDLSNAPWHEEPQGPPPKRANTRHPESEMEIREVSPCSPARPRFGGSSAVSRSMGTRTSYRDRRCVLTASSERPVDDDENLDAYYNDARGYLADY